MTASSEVRPHILRKDRERLARRGQILAAARNVFALKGYESATLDEIAERAQFAKGTLYNYFESKEDLFDEIVAGLLDDMVAIAKHAIDQGGSVRDLFLHYSVHIIEYYKKNEDVLMILMREMHRMTVGTEKERLKNMFRRLRKLSGLLANVLKKEFRTKTLLKQDPHDLAQVFVGLMHNRVLRYCIEGKGLRTVDTNRESEFLVRLFFDGVVPRPVKRLTPEVA